MFKTKEWESDVPKSSLDFGKKPPKKKSRSIITKEKRPNGIKNIKKNFNKPNKLKHLISDKSTVKSESNEKRNAAPGCFVRNPNNQNSKKVYNEPKVNIETSNRKHKLNKNTTKQQSDSEIIDISDLNVTNLDEALINVTRKKLNEAFKNDDQEAKLFGKTNRLKNKFRNVLSFGRNSIKTENPNAKTLRDKMLEKLKAAQFRYLNEKLYTTSGTEAQQLFQNDPNAFNTYHEGYQQQLRKWPVNPLDIIVQKISKMPKTITVADMGCGEALLSKRVKQTVRSFDLVATAPGVEACDMAHTPLLSASIDVAVYCLALMGTDLTQYLVEANRVLKQGGLLLIAEVESRFDDVDSFTRQVQKLGFKMLNLDKSHQVFFFMEFRKIQDPPAKKSKLPVLKLKPCIYKRR